MILISSFILLLLKIFLGLFIKLLLWEAFFLKGLVFVIIIGIFIFFNVFQYRYCDSTNIHSENHTYYITYAKLICLIKAQVFLYCFQDKLSLDSKEMLPIFENLYSIPVAVHPWLNHTAFKELYEEKVASMIQHFLGMTYGDTEFTLSLNDPYMVSDTKTGTILTVGELFTIYKAGIPFHLEELNVSIRLITPDVNFLTTGDLFNSNESLQQINQRNRDYLGYSFQLKQGSIQVTKYYRDVKMDYKGPLKGHFSFKVLASIDFMTLKTLANDIQTSIKRLLKGPYSSESKVILEDALEYFAEQHKEIKKNNLIQIYQSMNKYLIQLTFDKTLSKDNIHFSVIIDFNTNSDPIMKEIVTRIEQDPNLLQYLAIETHYPQSARISRIQWEQYHKLSLEGIKAHLPLAKQGTIIDNYMTIYSGLVGKHAIILL